MINNLRMSTYRSNSNLNHYSETIDNKTYSRLLNEQINNLTGISKIVRVSEVPQSQEESTNSGRIVIGGYRRVHQDGILMLDKHLHMKDSLNKVGYFFSLN